VYALKPYFNCLPNTRAKGTNGWLF